MHFGIVTPTYNGARYLREAMDSVFNQEGDFEVSYHVMDGGSTDETVGILREYEMRWKQGEIGLKCRKFHFSWSSEKDAGMYDAINRGFHKGFGEILAWVNADDLFTPGSFQRVATVMTSLPEVEWLKGITSYIDENSKRTMDGLFYLYDQRRIREGFYGRYAYFIQQTSVFWRRSLWERAGPIPKNLRLAGDYALWLRFANTSPLFTVDEEFALFRNVKGQLSEDRSKYERECESICRPTLVGKLSGLTYRVLSRLPATLGKFLEKVFFPAQVFRVVDWNSGRPFLIQERTLIR